MPAFNNLIGQRFYHWTVLYRGPNESKRVTWMCRCDCGKEKIIRAETLRNGDTKGCRTCVSADHVTAAENKEAGKTYGYWTVIKRARTRNGIAKWVCRCICGTERSMQIGALHNGHTRSCGCYNTTPEERAFYAIRSSYIRGAENRGLSWTLSDKEAVGLLFSRCYYCGVPPNRDLNNRSIAKRNKKLPIGGIDRVDNAKGYTTGNVVPCCRVCNIAKHTLSSSAFKDWIERVYHTFVIGGGCTNVDNRASQTGSRDSGANVQVVCEEIYDYSRRRKPRREIEVRLPIYGSVEDGALLQFRGEYGQFSESQQIN